MTDTHKWTKSQRAVIEHRGSDLLVSAAAGSGKTAVLVERILALITDKSHPVDIDRILVVTFTRSAAREMKERIGKTIEKRLAENPNDEHLYRQTALIANAAITTIDSFCINLFHNYFGEIDLSPDIRIADEGEIKLIAADVWNDILEEEYERADEAFIALTEQFAKRNRDDDLTAMLTAVHEKSVSHPYPDEWLDSLMDKYGDCDKWLGGFVEFIKKEYEELYKKTEALYEEAIAFSGGAEGCDVIGSDADFYKACADAADYETLYETASGYGFKRWNAKGISADDKEAWGGYKEKRDRLKKLEAKIRKSTIIQPPDTIEESLLLPESSAREIVRLVKLFSEKFSEAKIKEGVMDFSDAEHFALDILYDRDTKEKRPAARELSEYYEEVMIDEYQDSNALQEAILSGIARRDGGRRNYFMVGDVKQSIYRFRQADPTIFTAKQRAFKAGEDTLITLDKNFRSRDGVIDVVNEVFSDIMHEDIGGVEYDSDAMLKRGNESYDAKDDVPIKLVLGVKDDPAFVDEHMNAADVQAALIARTIEDIMKNALVADGDSGGMRKARYKDIAILGQTNSGNAALSESLSRYGIPTVTNQTFGYFDTTEIKTMISLLSVINNPIDDIAMAAVLHSPIVGLDNETLADIRAKNKGVRYVEAIAEYAKSDERVEGFLSLLSELRELSRTRGIHEVLPVIYEKTGYFEYAKAMPHGNIRAANLERLIDIAIAYADGKFSDLFRFIEHVKRQKEYELDMAGASEFSEDMDAVAIMTVHKSKGLEYPIVILSDIQKQLDRNGAGGATNIVVHPELGIAMPTLDGKRRIRRDNLYHAALSHFVSTEDKAERMRLLYVGMTRAREQLIICGTVTTDKASEIQDGFLRHERHPLSYVERLNADTYLDLLLPTFYGSDKVRLDIFDAAFAVENDVKEVAAEEAIKAKEVCGRLFELPDEATKISALTESLLYEYPHGEAKEYKNKYSVSEIKHAAIEENLEAVLDEAKEGADPYQAESLIPEFIEEEKRRRIPRFVKESAGEEAKPDTFKGALRGTAMHRFLECFDFKRDTAGDSFYAQLKEQLDAGLLKEEQRELLSDAKLKDFLRSPLAKRMVDAAKRGRLYKERAFVMGDSPSAFFTSDGKADDDGFVLVQGIIDAFFEEDDGIVLLDYKTDRVKTDAELSDRYKKQMELYADAIARATGIPVKERILYSFSLGREIILLED